MPKRTLTEAGFTDMPAAKTHKGLRRGKVTQTYRGVKAKGIKSLKKAITRKEVAQIAKQVLNRNIETKYYDTAATGQTVAQVNTNDSGHNTVTFDYPALGTEPNERVGAKIKLTGLTINANFWGMSGCSSKMKIQCYLVWFKGAEATVNIDRFLYPNKALLTANPAVSPEIFDVNCFRNLEGMTSIKVLASWDHFVQEEGSPYSGGANYVAHSSFQKYVKLNLTQELWEDPDSPGSYLPMCGELVLYTIADCGNRNAGSASTLAGIPVLGTSSGMLFNASYRMEYQDA